MAERICSAAGCGRPHQAKGFCGPCYSTWWRENNRERDRATRAKQIVQRTCVVCNATWDTNRRYAKFCSDTCKGTHYRQTMRRKCALPADHPVMLLIAEARKPKAKPKRVDKRTARQCPGCACWFSPLFHSAATQMVTCSKVCAARSQRRRRRAREHGARGSWTWADFMRVARKFGYRCAYCGEKPTRLDPDHVVPLSRGGSDSPSNLLPSCLMCNSSKCAMTLSEWSRWRAEREQEPRMTTWSSDDNRYWHLTDAILISPAA